MLETEAIKKKEMMAVCSMCELPVPDAKSCYTDPVDFTFLCIHCFYCSQCRFFLLTYQS